MGETVRDRLLGCLPDASRAERSIATFMLAQMASLPFETAASIAAKVKVSEATVGRFCRRLDYRSLKDLRAHLKRDIGDQPWLVSDRLRDLRDRTRAGEEQLLRSLELEMAALVSIYEIARTPEWARVARRLATTPSVFAVGFQTERGVAQTFVNQLQYLRDQVHLLDLAGGNFAALLASDPADKCLTIFEARRYSRMARLLAHDAHAAGIPVTLVTDSFCDWGHDVSAEMFVVPTEFNLFWESTAQMASLANLLVNSVFIELGPKVEERMNRIAELYGRFTGHVGGAAPLS